MILGKFAQRFREELAIFCLFLLWRTGLFVVSFLAGYFLPFRYSFPYTGSLLIATGLPSWLWSWGNFDGVHYITLANHGYDGFGTQVFFPLYPLLGNILANITHSSFVSLLLISNLSFLAAAIILYKLTRQVFDKKIAFWSLLFLFLSPVSFFFGAIYTESLFLLLILLAFWASGFWAGIFSLFSGATRLAGSFAGLSLLLAKKSNWWGVLSVFGLGSYIVYLWWRFGRPLFFLSAQSAFGGRATTVIGLVTPFQVAYRYLKIFLTVNSGSYDFWVAILEFLAFAFGFLVLRWLTVKQKVPRQWLIFSWGAYLLPSFSGTFSSMPRYLLTIFPIYVGLAMIKNQSLKYGILVVSSLLLLLLTALFTRGYFVS